MAALPAVPLGPVHDVLGPGADVRVRALNPRRNTFWIRQIFIESAFGDYVDLDSIRQARPFLQELLQTQLPFMVKITMHYRLSEEFANPENGELEVLYSERRMATVPYPLHPLADPDERLNRIITVARVQFEDRMEHARFNNSLQKFEGFLSFQIFTTPSRELAQLPAAPGQDFHGGCWKELPLLLRKGNQGLWSPKNQDNMCFRYCVMAHIMGCAVWSRKDRKTAAQCKGRPFYDRPPWRPSNAQRALPPVDVYVGEQVVNFDVLQEGSEVTLADIEKFEQANAGLIEVFVYQWSTIPWLNDDFQYLMPVRSPAGDASPKQTVLLLLHDRHYVLIYNFDTLSSVRSCRLPNSQQSEGHHSWSRCHRCMANFSRPETLRKHLAERVCSQQPGKRAAPPMQMPDAEKGADRLHYKAANSAALHPCVVYADFEVFNDRAPEQISGHKVLSKQHRVASFAYQAVGRAGFEVPLEHRINLKRSGCEDGELVIVEYLLRSLLDLAHHYKQWRSWTNKPCQMTQEDEDRFFEALECEICGAAFDLKNRKVLHHEHGTGKFLAAACNSCNLAIRLPSLIPVYFHNGASYDFHFILRYLAHVRGRQNSVDHDAEGIEGEASESEEIEEAAEEDFNPWRCDLSKIRLDVLVKRGEQCLTVRFGPLRFVDSTNIFPAGLSKLIEDCKTSCRGRDPGEAFPLLAERHPLFAAAQKQAHPCFMALQRRVPEWRAKVWELLLKKIPMPFDVLTGPECWNWPALLPQEAYDSVLTGERCSDEKYAEIREIVEFFGFATFGEFHDAYLHTDMALADVLEHYRETFYEHFKLDPCQYITHASASYDAMLRLCCPRAERSLGIMTDRRVYELAKCNIRGGLGHIAQPFAKANNRNVSGFDASLETSWIQFYDINSMYPSIMAKPLPVDGGLWIDLPSDKKQRLRRLNALFDVVDYNRDGEEVCYMVEVTFDVPWHRHSTVDWAPVCKMPVKKTQLSPYTLSLLQPGQVVSETPKLVPFLGTHVKEAVDLRYLKFIMEQLGARVFDFHSAVMFKCAPFMQNFVHQTVRTRRELKKVGRALQAEVQKLTGNVQYGKMVQNQEAFRSTKVYTDALKFQKKAAGPNMLDIHPQIMEEQAFLAFVDTKKGGAANVLKSFLQGGWKVLEESRLLMMRAHYRIRQIFDGHLMKSVDPVLGNESLKPEQSKVRWLGGDTDSSVTQIFSELNPKIALAEANLLGGRPFFDVAGDAKGAELTQHLAPLSQAAHELALQEAGALGNFSDELAPHYGEEWVGLAPKMYSLKKSGGGDKERAKGVPKNERKRLSHEKYKEILEVGGEHKVSFCRLGCARHVNEVIKVEKRGLTALNTKVWQLNAHQARPLGHYKNNEVWAACWEALQKGQTGFEQQSNQAAFHIMNHILTFIAGDMGFLHREISQGKFKGRLFNLSYLRSEEELRD